MVISNNNVLDVSNKILVYKNDELAQKLESALINHFAKSSRILGGNKLHTSSLTYCIRDQVIKSYLLSTGKNKPTDFLDIYAAMNFLRGLTSEYVLTKLLKDEIDPQKSLELENVDGHPDAVMKDNSAIIEMKNSNTYSGMTVDDDSLYTYMRQTIIYMIMAGIDIGHIIVIYNLPHMLEWEYSDKGKSHYVVQSYSKAGKRPFDVFTLNLHAHSKLRDQIRESLKIAYNHIKNQNYADEETIKKFPRLDKFPDNMKCKYCAVKKVCTKIDPDPELDLQLVDVLLNRVIDKNIIPIMSKKQ